MNDTLKDIFGWWVAVVEIPVISALFWMIWNSRRDHETSLRELYEDLSEHKLDVARNYARTGDLRELEVRITSHLLRIEAKLDVTALKAEALQAEKH
jgi:hypothetical protein